MKAGLVQALRLAADTRRRQSDKITSDRTDDPAATKKGKRSSRSSHHHSARVVAVAEGLADEFCALSAADDPGGLHARDLGALWARLCGKGAMGAGAPALVFPPPAPAGDG